jgi:hypothetical protein
MTGAVNNTRAVYRCTGPKLLSGRSLGSGHAVPPVQHRLREHVPITIGRGKEHRACLSSPSLGHLGVHLVPAPSGLAISIKHFHAAVEWFKTSLAMTEILEQAGSLCIFPQAFYAIAVPTSMASACIPNDIVRGPDSSVEALAKKLRATKALHELSGSVSSSVDRPHCHCAY